MSDGYGAACAPMRVEQNGLMATTRDLLDIAARWVAEHEGLSPRQAKARVHGMVLPELVAIPPVRVMLHDAARSARPERVYAGSASQGVDESLRPSPGTNGDFPG